MKLIQDSAAGVIIFCVTVLTFVSILGVWDFFTQDVIWKSFETFGLLGVVAVVVVGASQFVGNNIKNTKKASAPNPIFHSVRNVTLTVLILSAVLLSFVGVLAIWDVLKEATITYRAISSLSIITFSSLIIVGLALEREQSPFWKLRSRQYITILALAAITLPFILLATLGA